jgi:predicted Zn-dependent peptidase
MPHMQSASIGVWVGVGGRYEEKSENGISHLLEHVVFKGTTRRASKEIYRDIERIGGSLNAFTAEELTCFTAKVPGDYYETALDILSDLYLNPLINEGDLEKEKKVIEEEIHMYLDMPGQYVQDMLFSVMWPGHPLGRVLIGTEKSVGGIGRGTLLDYKEKKYTLKNTVVSIAGKVRHEAAEKLVRKYFPPEDGKVPPVFSPVEVRQDKPRLKTLHKKTEQTYLSLGIRACKREDPKMFALKILSIILGENASSRLFQEVREMHGLAYDVQTTLEKFIDTGALIINVGTDKKKALKCMELIMRELDRLRAEAIGRDELHTAKQYCLGQLAMSVEKTFDHMLWMGENLVTTDQVRTVPELIRGFGEVTSEDIHGLAREMFADKNLCLSVIGPVAREKDLAGTLHFA